MKQDLHQNGASGDGVLYRQIVGSAPVQEQPSAARDLLIGKPEFQRDGIIRKQGEDSTEPLMFVPVCLQEETANPKEVSSGVNSEELKIHRTQAVFEAAWVLFFYFKAEKLLSRQALCPASWPSG
mgnify:CR=1 FL=1